MFRPLISIRKHLFTKPKWKILRIYTKQIKRSKLEDLLGMLQDEEQKTDDVLYLEYLRGKIEILTLLLK